MLMKAHDIVICSLPPYPIAALPAAPGILRGCVEQYGFTARTLDLNQYLYITECKKSKKKYTVVADALTPFINFTQLPLDEQLATKKFIASAANKILELNPTYVGLSVFSSYMHKSTYMLCLQLKALAPNIKIIVGGRGVDVPIKQMNQDLGLTTKMRDMFTPFCQYLTDINLVDYTIIGDGEDAIVKILQQIVDDSDDRQTNDMFSVPVPNFDDYIFKDYGEGVLLPVTGSKGCVRNCEFCDVNKQYGKFKYRSGVDVANEMIALANRYHISNFFLNDSLVNGSLKAFTEFITVLAEYNQTATDKIIWSGQYISRPQSQVKREIYRLMKLSGANNMLIGVESGSNDVLKSINKKVTIEDVLDELRIFSEFGITCSTNIIPGYWNESWDNFLETIKFLKDIYPYVKDGTVYNVSILLPLVIYDRTPLWDRREEYKLHTGPYATDHAHMWWSELNPRLTLKERYYRKLLLDSVVTKLNYSLGDAFRSHDHIIKYLKSNTKEINEFYQTLLPNS